MKNKSFYKLGFVVLLIAGFFFACSLMNRPKAHNQNDIFNLQPPSFMNNTVLAAPSAQTGTSFLEDEAGVSAYTQISSGSIDLSQVRDAFRTIEYETTDYLIGSVAITDYPEDHDVHVYVNTSGWVVAYYRAEEPAAKIIDLRHYDGVSISTNKLKMAMETVLVEIGVVSFTSSYYDFRYPNATKLMLIAERYDGTYNHSFDLQLPDTFTFYERSWTHYHYDNYRRSILYLDGVEISNLYSTTTDYLFADGVLSAAQLPPSTYHTFNVTNEYGTSSAGAALVYNEGP